MKIEDLKIVFIFNIDREAAVQTNISSSQWLKF